MEQTHKGPNWHFGMGAPPPSGPLNERWRMINRARARRTRLSRIKLFFGMMARISFFEPNTFGAAENRL
jgi:hypothetical protein